MQAGNELKNDPALFFRIRQNLRKRCEKCIETNGAHFENLSRIYSNNHHSQ